MSAPGRRGRFGGLQFEIVANLFVVMAAGLAVVATVTVALAARTVEHSALERLRADARHLERLRTVAGLRLGDLAAVARTSRGASGAAWTVLDGRGRALGGAASLPPAELEQLVEAARQRGEVVRRDGPLSDLVLAVPLPALRDGSGVLVGVIPRSALLAELRPLLESAGLVLAAAAAVFVAFGAYLLRRRIVRPVRALSEATRRVAEGDLGVRMSVSGCDELAELAESFNGMAESLGGQRDALGRAHESLARSQRLAAAGQLAAGVAHEVGNPVAAILGYAELLLRDRGLAERSRDSADRIRAEALRIRGLVRELLDQARARPDQPMAPAAFAPGALLRDVAGRLSAQPLLRGIELAVEIAPGLPELYTDAHRVERVLVNLVENAAHALAAAGSGRIEMRADAAPEGPRARRRGDPPDLEVAALRRPDAVALAVIDDGPGIEPEALPRIFDPFFTTKDPGAGTGLGLWNAHRAAEALGGRLEVESAPGRTCFRLVLPAERTACGDLADTEGTDDGAAADPDHR